MVVQGLLKELLGKTKMRAETGAARSADRSLSVRPLRPTLSLE
jgi:hypothetical protein